MKRTVTHALRLGLVAGLVALGACSASDDSTATTVSQLAPRIEITSIKGDPKSELLAAIYARALQNAGVRVTRKDPIELDQAEAIAALEAGDFDLLPQFSADLLTYSLASGSTDTTVPANDAPATTQAPVPTTTTTPSTDTTPDTSAPDTSTPDTTVAPEPVDDGRSLVAQILTINSNLPTSIVVIGATAAESKVVIACTDETFTANEAFEFNTLTHLASLAPGIRLGAPASFLSDTMNGFAAWTRTYGGEFAATVPVEAADLSTAIESATADCYVTDSLDPVITTKSLTILTDDRYMVSTNAAVALVSSVNNSAEVTTALEFLTSVLTTERLNQMLNQIITNGTSPTDVANAFVDNL